MGSFEFEHDGATYELRDDVRYGICFDRHYATGTDGRKKFCAYEHIQNFHAASCIRALLANHAELVALYREAMEVARDCAGTMSSSFPKKCHVFYDKLDALDARFKKLEAGQ